MDPFVTGSLIGGGASILGNLFNVGSQRHANRANLQIARENNQFNEKMMEKQMAYNLDMFNRTNDYNSATSQRKRLEQAGLNPYMMMSGGNAGSAANTLGVTAPTASPATMVAPQVDSNSINGAVSNFISAANVEKQGNQLQMLTKTGYDLAQSTKTLNDALTKLHGKDARYKGVLADLAGQTYDLQEMNWNDLSLTYRLDVANKYMQFETQRINASSMLIQQAFDAARLPYADIFASNEAAMQASQIALNYANGKLSKAKAKEAMANVTLIGKIGDKVDIEAYGMGRHNAFFDKVFDVTVNSVKSHKQYLEKLYEGYGSLPSWLFTGERLGISPGAVKEDLRQAGEAIIGAFK